MNSGLQDIYSKVTLQDIWQKIKLLPAEVLWRTLSYLLSSTVLVPLVALVMFLFYMAEYDFFSYDFVQNGIFAMKLFFFTSLIFLVVSAFGLYGILMLLVIRKKYKVPRVLMAASVLITFAMVLALAISAGQNGIDVERTLFMAFVCALIAIHITVLITRNAKAQFISLGLICFMAIYLPAIFRPQAAQMVALGLSSFGVGGAVPATLRIASTESYFQGQLILVTPENIYFRPNNSKATVTYSRSSVEYYCISRSKDMAKQCSLGG